MTIKQNGGIFGRNPTFNDVTIEGELTFDGDIDVNSDLKVQGDIEGSGNISTQGGYFGIIPSVANIAGDYIEGLRTRVNTGVGNAWGTLIRTRVTSVGGGNKSGSELQFLVSSPGTTAQLHALTISDSGNLVIVNSGNGIDFSATSGTGTSELFDDYEEGTWTPTLVGSTSAGTATFVSGPTGIYTKIGNQVTVYFDWNISAHTGTGALRVNGLPFAKVAGVGVGTIMDGNYTYSAGRPRLVPYVVGSVLRFYGVGDGVGYLENALDTSHQINGSVTYTV